MPINLLNELSKSILRKIKDIGLKRNLPPRGNGRRPFWGDNTQLTLITATSTPSATMVVMAVPSVAAVPTIVTVPALVVFVMIAAAIMPVVVPNEQRRGTLVIAGRAVVIHNARRCDVTVVVADHVIDIVDVARDIVAQPLAHDHPVAIRLQTRCAIGLL